MNGGPRPLFHCVFCVLSRLFLSFVCFIANRFHFGNRRKKRRERRKHKRHRKTTNLNIGFTHTLHFFFIYNQKESAVSKGDPMLRLVIFQCPSRLLPSRHKRLTPCDGTACRDIGSSTEYRHAFEITAYHWGFIWEKALLASFFLILKWYAGK